MEEGVVISYRILNSNPSDAAQIESELDQHLCLFGRLPKLVAADRGCYSQENERLAEEMGVEGSVFTQARLKDRPAQGTRVPALVQASPEVSGSGSEGRISVLKRRGKLGRCRDHGEESFGRWVGWGILAGNLTTIARSLAGS